MWSPEWWSGWLPSGAFGSTWATSRSLDSARGAPQRRRRRGRRHVQAADDGRAGSPSCCPALDAAFRPTCSPVVRGFVAATAGAPTVDILMADYDLLVLRRLPVDMTGGVIEAMPVDDSPAGRAFIAENSITEVTDDPVHVYVPISVRAERLGVLDVVLRKRRP